MYSYELKIPKERVSVLIGTRGRNKKYIEGILKIKININSEGDVILRGEDSLKLKIGEDIIKAIGRGFNPDLAKLLLDEEYILDVIDITDFSGKSKDKLIRLRGRCIGTGGKSRKVIERLTKTKVSIYGKTISIIGEVEGVERARDAFEKLLRGSKHGNIYSYLEKFKGKRRTL